MKQLLFWLIVGTMVASRMALATDQVPTLIINSSNYPPITNQEKDGLLDQVYQEMARRAGVRILIQSLPAAERSLRNQNSGIDDGDVSRIRGLEKQYPNLVRVPESVMHFEMVAFSRKANFTVSGAASLAPYTVGIPKGWKILERNTAGARSVTSLENGKQLFAMLDKERIEIAIIEKFQGMHFVKDKGIKGIRILQKPLVEGDWFMYLNKKHLALVPKLAAVLRGMKADGTHQRILDGILKRYVF